MKIFIIIISLFSLNVLAMDKDEFIDRLKNTHPFFVKNSFSNQIKQKEKQITTRADDWNLSLDTTYNKNSLDTINFSANKKILSTGGDLIVSHLWNGEEFFNGGTDKFSISYSHPLLQNSGGINDRFNFDIADIKIKQNYLEVLEKEENFILSKLKIFIELAYLQERQAINEKRLELAKKELDLAKEKFAASVINEVDLLLQKNAYERSKQRLLQAQKDLNLLRQEIAITLDYNFNDVVADLNLYKIFTPKTISLDEFNNSRLLKIIDFNQDILKRTLIDFESKSKAKLNLKLGLGSNNENSVGLNFSYPLGNTYGKENLEKTRLQLLELEQHKKESLLNIYTKSKNTGEKIKLLEQILESKINQINVSKARTIKEKQLYADGNREIDLVIKSQDNEQDIKLSYAQTAKEYQQTVIEFKAMLDELIQ
jgi:outer membrane protein TolC